MKKGILFGIILIMTCKNLAQNVGIGTTNPNANLDVIGTIKITDGTQGEGKVLTSDATGLANWQLPQMLPEQYYPSVGICCQNWMTKNLDVDHYRNGDPIPKVTVDAEWATLTTGAYCYYNNDSTANAAVYGKLYNWYAVNDPRGLAPEGWHIATDFEYETLAGCLGGSGVCCGPMKEQGLAHWDSPNSGATNFAGFNAVPNGLRLPAGSFIFLGAISYWWTASIVFDANARYSGCQSGSTAIFDIDDGHKFGMAVRCIRD